MFWVREYSVGVGSRGRAVVVWFADAGRDGVGVLLVHMCVL